MIGVLKKIFRGSDIVDESSRHLAALSGVNDELRAEVERCEKAEAGAKENLERTTTTRDEASASLRTVEKKFAHDEADEKAVVDASLRERLAKIKFDAAKEKHEAAIEAVANARRDLEASDEKIEAARRAVDFTKNSELASVEWMHGQTREPGEKIVRLLSEVVAEMAKIAAAVETSDAASKAIECEPIAAAHASLTMIAALAKNGVRPFDVHALAWNREDHSDTIAKVLQLLTSPTLRAATDDEITESKNAIARIAAHRTASACRAEEMAERCAARAKSEAESAARREVARLAHDAEAKANHARLVAAGYARPIGTRILDGKTGEMRDADEGSAHGVSYPNRGVGQSS